MADIAELERLIGTPPGQADLRITPRTKGLVQQWMIEHGLNPARVGATREKTIRRAYVDPHFLRTLKTRRDYCPTAGEEVPCTTQERPPTTQERPPTTQEPAWESRPVMTSATVGADPLHAFAAALQNMMPPGVSEERVLQLIYDHVPGLIKLALAETFGELASKLSDDEEC